MPARSDLWFDSIILNMNVNNQKQLFQKLAQHTSKLIGTPEETLYENLMRMEEQQNSSMGHGVAIPHHKLPRLTRPMFIFSKLGKAIQYHANDGDPVDLICFVLSPKHEGPIHLRRLAKAARFLNNKEFRQNLRDAKTKDDIKNALQNANTSRKMTKVA